MRLHSILLTGSSEEIAVGELPQLIAENIASMKQLHSGWEHALYQDKQLRNFIVQNFSDAVVTAYDNLIPLAYKADLGRLCLLYEYGGLYSDLSVFFLSGVQNLERSNKLGVFRDVNHFVPWAITNALIFAPPKNQAIEACINAIVENSSNHYYGSTAHCPTGPVLIGKVLSSVCEPMDLIAGKRQPAGGATGDLGSFIQRDGSLLAIRRKKGVGLKSLGLPDSGRLSRAILGS